VAFSLFITMPHGKFVHGIYRFVALLRYARERLMMSAPAGRIDFCHLLSGAAQAAPRRAYSLIFELRNS
jgi:hypothetical protein